MSGPKKNDDIAIARDKSRRNYLEKREGDKIALFGKALQDETDLLQSVLTTKEEEKVLLQKKTLFDSIKDAKKIKVIEEQYAFPVKTETLPDSKLSDFNERILDNDSNRTLPPDAKNEYVFESHKVIKAQNIEIPKKTRHLGKSNMDDIRKSLPVYTLRDELMDAVKTYQVVIVVGETGSGKTTQIPQYLIEAGLVRGGKKVGCTQPRRVAAMSVASRVAEEIGCKIGEIVGYSIRFEDYTSSETILKYMTDGMLLREFMLEADLSSYDVIIVDEAHERTLHTDVILGLLKDLIRHRDDLKIIISSATIDASKFSLYFDSAPIFTVPGRRYDVDIYFTKEPEPDYISASIKTIMQIHLSPLEGDILVFLPGQEEIDVVEENLDYISERLPKGHRHMLIAPIYANLPSELQAKIFLSTPASCRKIVLATNIAETSITIDGIVFVVDPGYVKQNSFEPRSGIDALTVVPCSQASAGQRAGRAGRVGPGKCFRLYTKWAFENEMDVNTVPEIRRSNIVSVILLLKSLGVDDLINFDFIEPPSPESLLKGFEELYSLGAFTDNGQLTKMGKRMSEIPVDPKMTASLFAAARYRCVDEVLSIISILSVQGSIFVSPKNEKGKAEQMHFKVSASEGDHLTYLTIWRQWSLCGYSASWARDHFLQVRNLQKARDIRAQISIILEKIGLKIDTSEHPDGIRKSLLTGYANNIASRQKKSDLYKILKSGRTVLIHPSSVLSKALPDWVFFHELVLTSKEFIRQVSEFDPVWLKEISATERT